MRMTAKLGPWGVLGGLLLTGLLLAGCQSGSDNKFAEMPAYTGVTGADTASGGSTAGTNGAVTAAAMQSAEEIHPGDSLTVVFSDTPQVIPPFEERVKDDGTITLLQNQSFKAAGKTRGDLEQEIRTRYVPSYYRNLTVTIKPQDRFFFVGGEVKAAGRQIYLGRMTVIKAIQSCGDFTDFANKKKVQLVRVDGTRHIINVPKAYIDPALDLEVLPGDKIHVPRRVF